MIAVEMELDREAALSPAPGEGLADMTAEAAEGADALRELVSRVRAGDEAAFADLHRRFAPSVHGVLLVRLQRGEADEVTQEVFVNAHARLDQLREPASIGPWLLSIARNLATDRLRARRREPAQAALPDDVPAPPEPDGELRARVLHHIRSLPEAYRETLLLRLVEGLSGPEIAAATGLGAGSVRVNLCRGMEMLRPLLRKEGWP